MPADAEAGAKLIPLGHRLSRELLEVHGLGTGKYQLSINDRIVGAYTAEQLEAGLELQGNDKTPQYQQGAKVTALNAQRNVEAVRPLRTLWRSQKVLRLKKLQLAQSPDNEATKAEVVTLEKPLVNIEEQITALEAKAAALEDQIYAANQPQPLKYRLLQVPAGSK